MAFAAFSMLAGAVYTINDLVDVDEDRQHPTKKLRPIASGEVPESTAKFSAVVLVTLALTGAFVTDWRVGLVALGYLAQNLAYSLRLKKIAYLDVGIIALGFVLRVLAGCYAASSPVQAVKPSVYLLGCTAFLALFLGFGKRYHELRVNQARSRSSLMAYDPKPLRNTLWLTAIATVAIYLAWTLNPPEALAFGKDYLWLTTPLVLLGIGRFVFLLTSTEGESPTDAMLRDVPFVVTVIGWAALVVTIIYQLRPAGT